MPTSALHSSPIPFAIYNDPEDSSDDCELSHIDDNAPLDQDDDGMNNSSTVISNSSDDDDEGDEDEDGNDDDDEEEEEEEDDDDNDTVEDDSRRQSQCTSFSSIPPSLPSVTDGPYYLPPQTQKPRPPFRSPSSVRAIQMASPSPLGSPRLRGQDAKTNASGGGGKWGASPKIRRIGVATPERVRESVTDGDSLSGQKATLRHLMAQAQAQEQDRFSRSGTAASGTGTPSTIYQQQQPSQTPLILLHVSVLPTPGPDYPRELLEAYAPKYILDNYQLLGEKVSEVILARGILVTHPGEEYDLLEERLLESLELCTPRLLGCGHFYGTQDEDEDTVNGASDGECAPSIECDEEALAKRAICDFAHAEAEQLAANSDNSHGQDDDRYHHHDDDDDDDDEDMCSTCTQRMRLPNRGVGHGTRRWDVKFFAANGLMRAGAWAAAWREMERVDVTIAPWLPEHVRRALAAAQDKAESDALEKERQERKEMDDREDLLLKLAGDVEAARNEAADAGHRLREAEAEMERIVAEAAEAAKVAETARAAEASRPHDEQRSGPTRDASQAETIAFTETKDRFHSVPQKRNARLSEGIPLSILLRNYIYLLAQDKRNVAVAMLSLLVLLLSFSQAGRVDVAPTLGPTAPVLGITSCSLTSSLPTIYPPQASMAAQAVDTNNGTVALRATGQDDHDDHDYDHDDNTHNDQSVSALSSILSSADLAATRRPASAGSTRTPADSTDAPYSALKDTMPSIIIESSASIETEEAGGLLGPKK